MLSVYSMLVELLLHHRIGLQQVANFTSVELVRLAAGYPKLSSGNGDAM